MRRPTTPSLGGTLLALLVAVGCGSQESGEQQTGSVQDVEAAPLRVISLVPSATQTLRAIGADGLLVGRTDFDNEPWTTDIPSVGGGLEPNLEEIIALQPDLVIRFAGGQDARTPARLDDLGIAQLEIRPDNIEDVYGSITAIGVATGRAVEAQRLVDELRAELASLRLAVSSLPRFRAVYVLGGEPPWVAGPGSYIDDIVTLVGGDNAFSDLGSLYASVSAEEMRVRPIDVVLVSSASDFDSALTPNARVVEIGATLEIPGPGMAAAAWHVAELVHGTLR